MKYIIYTIIHDICKGRRHKRQEIDRATDTENLHWELVQTVRKAFHH